MKVLFFSHQAAFIFGGEIVTLEMMRALGALGLEVHFASPPGPYADRAKAIVQWHEVPSVEFSRKPWGLPSFLSAYFSARKRIREIIAAEKIDLLHAQSLKAAVYARGLNVPVIWHHHDIMPATFVNDMWLRWLAKGVEGILVPSLAAKDGLIMAGVDQAAISVIENGFPLENWSVRPGRIVGEKFNALVVGEISYRKGSDWIPAIVAEWKKTDGPAFDVKVVGEGLSDKKFSERVKSMCRVFPEIEFLGRRNDVHDLLQKADVLMVPSRQDPLPTVIVEAMLSGVPVLAVPVGGIPEMVVQNSTGFFCSSPKEFAEKLRELEANRELWRELSVNARFVAEKKYAIKRVAEQLRRFYRDILTAQ